MIAQADNLYSNPWQVAKCTLAGTFYYTGLLYAWQHARRSLGAPRVHVLAFHRIVADFEATAGRVIPALCTSTRVFEAQLRYVKQNMEVLDLGAALEVIRSGRRMTRDVCVLTFDDGYRDTYTRAFPLLRRLGLPATVFVPTGFVDTDELLPHDRLYAVLRVAAAGPERALSQNAAKLVRRARVQGPKIVVEEAARRLTVADRAALLGDLERSYGPGDLPDEDGHILTWDMCREMAEAGIEIGSHSVSHAVLPAEPRDQAMREITESKSAIERNLGRRARFFAYPNGAYSDAIVSACAEAGYEAAVTVDSHPNRKGTHPLRIGRKVLWEVHGRGLGKRPSRAIVASHLENLYGEWQHFRRPKSDVLIPIEEASR